MYVFKTRRQNNSVFIASQIFSFYNNLCILSDLLITVYSIISLCVMEEDVGRSIFLF